MREINNNPANPGNVNFKGVQPKSPAEETAPQKPAFEGAETTDLGKMPAETIGRSQVAKSALDKDVEFFNKNPEKVEDLNRMFEHLVKEKGLTYEKAAEIVGATAKEFSKPV